MKINHNNLNYKILIEMLNSHLDSNNKMPEDKKGLNGEQKNQEPVLLKSGSYEIVNLLKKMNPQDRQTLISYLLKNNLPLDNKNIQKLISYLNKTSTNNSDMIKSFIILMKNNIPVNKSMLEGIASNLNQEKSLANKLNDLINIAQQKDSNTTNINKSLIHTAKELLTSNQPHNPQIQRDKPVLNIIKQLILNPSRPTGEIIDQLKEYPEKLRHSIQLLQGQSGNIEQKISQHLTGQQIINHQDKNLLLQLEIPLLFPKYKKIIPSYLTIKRNINKNSRDNKSPAKNYKIDFIISLEKRGIIKAETYISTGRAKILFTCNKRETMDLIESEFISLKENLEQIGINVEEPAIEYSEIKSDELNALMDDNIEVDHSQFGDFLHIDIKV